MATQTSSPLPRYLFWRLLSCLICPVLAYGVLSSGFASPWLFRIADMVDGNSAPDPGIVANEHSGDIDPDTYSPPQMPDADPVVTQDAQHSVLGELASSSAAPSAESKSDDDLENYSLTSELSAPALQSAGAVAAVNNSAGAEISTPDHAVELSPALPKRAILFAAARWFIFGWCLLIAMLGSRMLFRSLRLKRLLADARVVENPEVLRLSKSISERTGLRQIPSVVVSSKIAVPFVYGMSSSKIAIPEFLLHPSCVEQLRDVLAHEMCHLGRGDLWMSCLQRMVQLVYCVNPFIHVIAATMTRVREEICDNHVLQFTSPAGYCRTLLSLAERVSQGDMSSRPLHVLPLGTQGGRWSLESRVADLLLPARRRETRLQHRSAGLFIAVFCTLIVLISRVMIVSDAVADEGNTASTSPANPSTIAQAGENPQTEKPVSEAEALLKQVLERSRRWTGSRSESLKSLWYEYELADRKQTVELVSGVSAVRRSEWEGTTLTSGIHWLATDSSAFEIALERRASDSNSVTTDAKELIRFVCKRRESAKPMGIEFGNGIEGRWSGYFSKGFQEVVIDVDGSTLLPVQEQVGGVTVNYGEWKQADTAHWVPGLVSVRHQGTQWDMYFDWLADSVWLLKESELVSGNQKSVIARTLNIRVNDQDVVRKLTERERLRQESTASLRKLFEHNRFWLQPELTVGESLSYTFHTEREDVKEACYINKDGTAAFEVTHDGQNKLEGSGKRKIALPNGDWATGDRTQEYVYPHKPNEDDRSKPYGHQLRNYALIGCQLDLPLFRLNEALDNIQATATSGQWNGVECDVSQIAGPGRSAWLGCGTMLAFSSWSYVHHIYPVSTTLYVDKVRHVPLHESIRGGRDHDFEIDYLDWKEVEPGQWVPMSIRIESAGYFTCELQFQLVNDRHWMLKEVTSWFDVANKSRGVVSDVQVDQASELWNQTKVQLDATQSLFSQQDVVVEQSKDSQAMVETTPLTFGTWVTVDRVKAMLTLSSSATMELKVQSAESLRPNILPVMLLDKTGQVVSSGLVHLQQDGNLWKGSMKVSAMNAETITSIEIATQTGQVKQQIDVSSLVPNKAQAVNVPDNESGKTRVAEIELSKGESEKAILRLKVVSINGPKEFPVTANVVLFDEQRRIVACGEQSQSIRVDGGPSVNDLTIDVGKLQKFSNVRYAAISVRNGEATSQPMGSGWASSVGFPEVVVPTEALFAADDTLCHQIAVQRLIERLSHRATENEMFGDARDRERAVERKQLRSDIVKPHAEALARVLASDASDSLKQDAARLLGHSGDQSQIAVLLPLLESSDEQIRDIAAISLGMLGNEAGFKRLEPILQITSPLIDETILKTEGADWRKKRDAWAASRQVEGDILISLVSLRSDSATDLLGRTLMSNLENLLAGKNATDDEGRSKVANRTHRVNRILAISKYAYARIVQWLTSAVEFAELHPEINKLIETSSLADALLAHEEQGKYVIAGQIRKLNLPFVYAIKENRNPYYVSAVREMLLNPSVDSWMYQKGIEYLWSVGKPESVEVFQELYDHKGPDDYKARMRLCEALIHFEDPRGLPDALAVMADSYGNAPESPDEKILKANLKLNEDKRSQSMEVLERANDEMLFAAVLEQIHSENIGMRRAILHSLRSRNSLPAAVMESVRSWSRSDTPFLSAEARDFMTSHGIDASP